MARLKGQDVVNRVETRFETTGDGQAKAALENYAAANETAAAASAATAGATRTVGASVVDVERKFTALQRRYIEGVKAAQDFARAQTTVNNAVKEGVITQEQAEATLDAIKQKLFEVRAAEDAVAAARALHIAQHAQYVMNQQLGLDRVAKSARESASAFEELLAAEERATAEQRQRQAMAMTGLTPRQAAAEGRALQGMNMGRLSAYGDGSAGIARQAEQAAQGLRAARQETQMLQYQLFDMGTMLAGGASPFMIMATQGPQIAQQLSGQGLRGGISAIGTALMGLLTPLNLGIAGFAAMAVGVSYLWSTWEDGAPTVEEILKRQIDIAKQLKELYGEAAENAERVKPPNIDEVRFFAGMNLRNARQLSVDRTTEFLNGVGAFNRNGFNPAGEFSAFVGPLNSLAKSLETGTPAISRFREEIVALSARAPDAAQELLKLAEGIIDVNAAAEQAEKSKFLSRLDPRALAIGLRQGEGYAALDAGLAGWSGLHNPNVPTPTANPSRDLSQDPAKIPGTQAADLAAFNALMAASDRRIAQLQTEAQLIPMGQQAVDAYRLAQEMQNQAVADGIELNAQKIAAIQERANAEVAAAAAIREQQEAVKEAERAAADAQKFFGDSLEQMLMGIARGGDSAKQAILGLIAALAKGALLGEGPLRGLFKEGGLLAGLMKSASSNAGGSGAAAAVLKNAAGAAANDNGVEAAAGAPVGAVSRSALAPVYGQPPIAGLQDATRQGFGLPPIPGLMRHAAGPSAGPSAGVFGAVPYGTVFGGVAPSAETLAMLNATAARYGINPAEFATMARIESVFRPGATNGSMKGMFQFSPDTAAQYGLTDPFDPAASADAAARLWMDNKSALSGMLGRQPVGWELYAAHQQGIGGMSALLRNPDMNAAGALNTLPFYANRPGLANLAITGNGGNLGMTSTQFLDVWKGKFEAMLPPMQQMPQVLDGLKQATAGAGGALQQLPSVLGSLTGGGGGGGGILGLLGGLVGGGGGIGGLYAAGGVADRPSIFGEAGPEAAVPLPDGRRIPVELRRMTRGEGRARSSGSFTYHGGSFSMVVQGNADDAAMQKMRAEWDMREKRIYKTVARSFEDHRKNEWRSA